jgi:hypothetical protein
MSVNTSGWLNLRSALARLVWPSGYVQTAPTVQLNQPVGYAAVGDVNCASVDVLTWAQPLGNTAVVHLLHPRHPNGRAVYVGPGHAAFYWTGTDPTTGPNLQTVCAELLLAGWTIFGGSMPGIGYSPTVTIDGAGLGAPVHDTMGQIELMHPSVCNLVWFVDPVIRCLDYAQTSLGIATVAGIALSGSGWTIEVAGALDPRLNPLYPVFSSLPLPMRATDAALGDYEQLAARSWWTLIANSNPAGIDPYEACYALDAIDPGRRVRKVLGNADTVFPIGTAQLTYLTSAFNARVQEQVPSGQFDVWTDTQAVMHTISTQTLARIFADLG